MHTTSLLSRLSRWSLVAFALACAPLASAAEYRLVTGAAKSVLVEPATSPRILRQRAVTLDLPAAAKAAGDARASLQVAFFEDAVFNVFLKRQPATHSGGSAYSGEVAGIAQSMVILVDNDGTVTLRVSMPGKRFSIRGSAERGYVAREHVDADRPDHGPQHKGTPNAIEDVPAPRAKDGPVEVPPPETARDDGSTIDVLVVYTPAARAAAGSTAQMNTDIDAEITQTNAIYNNSNVVQRLRLVYKGEVAYTEVDMDTDLPRLRSGTDGHMDSAPILRDLYRADFVALLGVYNDYCGLGYLMATENATFAASAFSITSQDCIGPGNFTFAHELGHNMGLRHDNFQDTTALTRVTPEAGGPLTDIFYAHGYIDLTNRFRTVMAYNDQCAAQPTPFSCFRAPHFSNPSVNFNNSAFFATAVSAPTGNAANAHERQALNDTRDSTANFRQPQLTLAELTGPGTITFLPTTGSVAEGGGNIVLTVGRHLGSTGAVSVSFTTNPGTASAGSDYTTTAGTLNWAAGDAADKTITVPIIQDTVLEGHETFTVTLSAPTNGATIASGGGTATVRIIDDEPDTFPAGGVLPAGYTTPDNPNANTANSQWTVDATQGRLSTASLQSAQARSPSGGFTEDGTSDLEYTANFSAGPVSFYYKLSSYHQNLAGFEFQVDGVAVFSNNAGGEVDWTLVTHNLAAGQHTLRWRFKNKLPFPCANAIPAAPGGSNCADRAWIDSVTLPSTTAPPPPPANPPRLSNISTRMQVLTGNDVMIGGFVIGGSANKTVVVRARGPSLVPFGITNALANPQLQLVRSSDQATLANNDDWQTAGNAAAITASGFAPGNNLESAILMSLPPGAYTAIVTGVGGGTGVGIVEVFEVDGTTIPLANISTRGQVLTGNDVMIGGFVVQGTGPQTVVVRARGPSLIPFGITNALANPTLQLVRSSDQVTIATNDDFGTAANLVDLNASGFAPGNALESAILISLQPGAYTAIVTGVGGGTGVGIVEVFTTP